MLILHVAEQSELGTRPQVELEAANTVDDVVVDALGVPPVVFATRQPAAFENRARIVRERRELKTGRRRRRSQRGNQHGETNSSRSGAKHAIAGYYSRFVTHI